MSVGYLADTDELPEPSAELVLLRVAVEVFIATADLKKGRGLAAMKLASEILATEESVSLLFPIRPSSQHVAVNTARLQAIAMFKQWIPVFLARVPK